MKVLIADQFSPKAIEELKAAGLEVIYDANLNGDTLTACLAEKKPAVLVVRSTKVQPPQIDAGIPELKMVVRAGSGYDTIDTAYAKEKGVAVCNTPGINATAVAELVFAHILNADRRISENVTLFRQGKWNKAAYASCPGLKGRTLGLVGFGNIGLLVANRAHAFEMEVMAYDPVVKAEVIEKTGTKYVTDLMDIAKNCDFVSIHVPGGNATKGLISKEFIAAMKDGATLINTARATVVDEEAMIEKCKAGKLFACLDVMSNEPAVKKGDFTHPLSAVENIYCTHHIGASTLQAESAIGDEAARVVMTFSKSGEILHQVNK
ncbi:phosphoglycerate dehydrogenase [Blattamonas nauphoetae]|uniref:Phosphoglycerate dehydrogenase n=1 Tax=Blattamonas nauphoetae TaxID=2049346 RepID=A0ABQ9XHT7_9EUKA|nr:phosphoglycerate dehydrogenase [Blattamonas nauphoetae]